MGLSATGEREARLAAWLEPRLAGVPAELAAAIRALALARPDAASAEEGGAETGGALPRALARAALAGLDRVARGAGGRDAALDLLAADAALTYAFEAAAEGGADLRALADEIGLRGEIGRRLAGRSASRDAGARSEERGAGERGA